MVLHRGRFIFFFRKLAKRLTLLIEVRVILIKTTGPARLNVCRNLQTKQIFLANSYTWQHCGLARFGI